MAIWKRFLLQSNGLEGRLTKIYKCTRYDQHFLKLYCIFCRSKWLMIKSDFVPYCIQKLHLCCFEWILNCQKAVHFVRMYKMSTVRTFPEKFYFYEILRTPLYLPYNHARVQKFLNSPFYITYSNFKLIAVFDIFDVFFIAKWYILTG